MQKKYLLRAILLILSVGIIFACVYEDSSVLFNRESFMEEAQKWFDENRGKPVDVQFAEGSPGVLIKPEWKYPNVQRKEEYATLEVPILSDRYFGFIDPECMKKYRETKDYRYILSETHLVIRKNLETNEMDGFLMTTSPDLKYLESTGFNPFRDMCYLFRDKDFSGFIIYHDLDGNYVSGWQYRDGEAYSIYSQEKSQTDGLRSYDCDMIYGVFLITECWSQYTEMGAFTSDLQFGCSQYLEFDYLYTTCYETGSGNYPPSGGGGGATSTGNNPPNTIESRTDCSGTATTNGTNANNIMNDVNTNYQKVKPLIQELRAFAVMGSNEYGLAVNYATEQYYVYNFGDQNNPQFINSGIPNGVYIATTANTVLTAHTHPFGTNPAPSPSDAIFLAKNYKEGSYGIRANVEIGAEGSEYMVYIDNVSTLAAFCNNSSNSDFFERDGSSFKQGSTWRTEYESVYNRMVEQGYSINDAQSYALSYALRNTGMKVYQKRNGAFKEQKTEVSNNNYSAKICP